MCPRLGAHCSGLVQVAGEEGESQLVALGTRTGNDGGRLGGDVGVVAEGLPLVHVGEVYFDDWQFGCFQGVVEGDGGVGVGGRVDDDTGGRGAGGLDGVDEVALVVGLHEADLVAQFGGLGPQGGFDVGEGSAPVDFGFADAEQVEVGAVNHGDVPGCSLWCCHSF